VHTTGLAGGFDLFPDIAGNAPLWGTRQGTSPASRSMRHGWRKKRAWRYFYGGFRLFCFSPNSFSEQKQVSYSPMRRSSDAGKMPPSLL